jgi:protein gp37
MSSKTGIEWTDATWNPITGCTAISPGCAHCYAKAMAKRLQAQGQARYRDGFAVKFHQEALKEPLHWTRPRRVFVCSMGDLFHGRVTDRVIDHVFCVMALARQHTFQVLTKRPERMRNYIEAKAKSSKWLEVEALSLGFTTRFVGLDGRDYGLVPWPLPNVWVGVTAENQAAADERVPLLLETPAAVRFVSCEPLLGPVNLRSIPETVCQLGKAVTWLSPAGELDWVICGSETGGGARPMDLDWARDLRDQCVEAEVPFFYKGAGWPKKDRTLDGRRWEKFPGDCDPVPLAQATREDAGQMRLGGVA